jgi:hypothetical protein
MDSVSEKIGASVHIGSEPT